MSANGQKPSDSDAEQPAGIPDAAEAGGDDGSGVGGAVVETDEIGKTGR